MLPGVVLAEDPEWAETATLHDLLLQQGGLFDFTPWDDNPDYSYGWFLVQGVTTGNDYFDIPV